MEENITELIFKLTTNINLLNQPEESKAMLLQMCQKIKQKAESETMAYDVKFIETAIRSFGYALDNEVNDRCKKIVAWYSAVQEENQSLKDELLGMELEICLLKNDLAGKLEVTEEMQAAYEHMQKVKTGKLRFKDNIKNEEIALLYKQGKGATEIGRQLGCNRQTVINRLKKMNLWQTEV